MTIDPDLTHDHAPGTDPTPHPDAGPDIPDPKMPPPVRGRFQPVRFHRSGGMGRVFLATDTELDRPVAFKDIHPRHHGVEHVLRLFEFEAAVTGRLQHPGVVPVYGLGRTAADRPFYAMRFVEGQSLAEAVRTYHAQDAADPYTATDRAVAFRNLLTRFLAVCQTVAYAHSRGVIHRDLKPANVLLGPFGETLVVDWGLAKQLAIGDWRSEIADQSPITDRQSPTVLETWTRPGAKLGSPAYWSPEQAGGRPDEHDERTDVYGLGGILFEIVCGEPPHRDGIPSSDVPDAGRRGAAIDDELDEIICTALAPSRDDRFQAASELGNYVERWLADEPVSGQRAAVRAVERAVQQQPGSKELRDQLARQQANLGLMYLGMRRPLRAARVLTPAVRWYESLVTGGTADARDRAELAHVRLNLAAAFDLLALPDQAAEMRAAAAAVYRGLIATDPDEYGANVASMLVTHAGAEPPVAYTPGSPALDGTIVPGPGESANVPLRPAPAPELIHGYTVLRTLGEGALGRVLLAKDNALNRTVAIKDFRDDLAENARGRVVRELQITAGLVDPNVVRIYTYGVHATGRRPFMVMEHIAGRTLRDELRDYHRSAGPHGVWGDPKFARLIEAVAQACDGVHFAHGKGVVHRDPKPANVMVDPTGRAVVIDWGLAKQLMIGDVRSEIADQSPIANQQSALAADLTAEGAVLGTPAYLAPERASGRVSDPGYRSDIYSLGAGLYEVLTGELPYQAVAAAEVIRQVVFENPRPPRFVSPGVAVELEAVCATAMAYEPADRYQTAAAFAADLRAWLTGATVSVRSRGKPRGLWERLTARG